MDSPVVEEDNKEDPQIFCRPSSKREIVKLIDRGASKGFSKRWLEN